MMEPNQEEASLSPVTICSAATVGDPFPRGYVSPLPIRTHMVPTGSVRNNENISFKNERTEF